MAIYKNSVQTAAGRKLENRVRAGEGKIEILFLKTGSGVYTEEEKNNINNVTSLKDEKQTFYFSSIQLEEQEDYLSLKSVIKNEGLSEGYYISEIGIFARMEGTEDAVLYCIGLVDEPDYMPSQTDNKVYEIVLRSLIKCYDAANLSICYKDDTYALAEDVEVLSKKVETTEDKIDDVSEDLNNMIKQTTSRILSSSHAGRIRINEIGGASEQQTTTGAQLFRFADGLNASNTGVTVKANEDGTLSVVGEATEGGGIFALGSTFSGDDVVLTLKAGTYYISGLPEGLTFFLYKTGDTVLTIPITTTEGSFTLGEDTNFCSISLRWSAGVTFNTPNTKIMLNEGTAAIPWEIFSGGKVAPSPDYPMEIKSVVVSEIKTVGKNLLQNTATTQTINGVNFTVNEDGSVTVNGTATANANFYLKQSLFDKELIGKEVIVSGCPSGGGESTYMLYMYNQTFGNGRFDTGNGFNTVIAEDDYSVFIQIKRRYTANNLTFYPMIRKADIADAIYEPYKESAITLSNPITLDGIGDAMDKIVRKDGAWGAERVIHNYTPGGVSKLAEEGTFGVIVMPGSVKPRLSTPNILCNVCEATTTLEIGKTLDYAICCYGNFLYLRNADIENKAAAYNTWLKNNTVTVFYERAESVFEPLPDVDQIALNSLVSFDTVTYLSCDSGVQPTIDVEYGKSKVGALSLENSNLVAIIDIMQSEQEEAVEAVISSIEAEYSTKSAYVKGNYCIYNNVLYECIVGSTNGEWRENDWKRITLANIIERVKSSIDTSTTKLSDDIMDISGNLADEYSGGMFSTGDYRIYNNVLYKYIGTEGIPRPSQFYPSDWEATTVAAELTSLKALIESLQV